MQALIVVTFVSIFFIEFLASIGWSPQLLTFAPEILGVVVAGLVIVAGVRSRFQYLHPMYWLAFGSVVVIVICGAVVNHLQPGPMFAGMRIYLRALPFFFLPAVMDIKEKQLHAQLSLLLLFALLQVPIATYQRMATIARGGITGDDTFGTLMNSATLSLFLASAACILTGFFLRKCMSAKVFFILLFLLLIPTMLNETKATLIIVPVALTTCFIIGAPQGARFRNTVLALVTIVCFLAVFIPVYDYFVAPRWGYGIVDFFTMEGRLEGYLDPGRQLGEYDKTAGKLGGLRVALLEVCRNPVTSAFGLGIGNASDSALGVHYTGKFYNLYEVFLTASAVYIIFEFGIAGIFLVLFIYWLIFRDSVYVAHHDSNLMGAVSVGWAGVVTVFFIGTFYHNLIDSRALSILFWYFSGLIAAYRMRLDRGEVKVATS